MVRDVAVAEINAIPDPSPSKDTDDVVTDVVVTTATLATDENPLLLCEVPQTATDTFVQSSDHDTKFPME